MWPNVTAAEILKGGVLAHASQRSVRHHDMGCQAGCALACVSGVYGAKGHAARHAEPCMQASFPLARSVRRMEDFDVPGQCAEGQMGGQALLLAASHCTLYLGHVHSTLI